MALRRLGRPRSLFDADISSLLRSSELTRAIPMLYFATLTAATAPPPAAPPPLPLEAGAARLRLQFAWDILNLMPAHLFEADWAASSSKSIDGSIDPLSSQVVTPSRTVGRSKRS